MTTGTVTADLEPLLRLTVHDAGGTPHDLEAVVDTGFNGFLTLPPAVIAALGLPWLCRQQGQLADGSLLTFDVHVATVIWHGQPRGVEVEAADAQPLLGMAMMRGSELRIQVEAGGSVTISESPGAAADQRQVEPRYGPIRIKKDNDSGRALSDDGAS